MKRYITLLLLTFISGLTYAQTADDALRYSQEFYTGTARSAAMGGAFGALGGDFSSISINPAGLGVYQSSEFTFSPTMEMRQSTSGSLNDDKFTFGLSNIGYVATIKPRMVSKNGWQNLNIGIGYNRINNFRKSSISQLENSPSSMLDDFAANAEGLSPEGLSPYYNDLRTAHLIDTINGTSYISPLLETDLMYQKKTINEEGYMGEFNLALGANYAHKLYLGASLGIQSIYYKSKIRFYEGTYDGSQSSLIDYSLDQSVKTNGIGANLKLGIIYKPTNSIRLGASLHTPTFYSMEDEHHYEIASNFDPELYQDEDGYNSFEVRSGIGTYSYNLRTPMKTTFSVAAVLMKKVILSVDYELIDYSKAKFEDKDYPDEFTATNDNIKYAYQNVGNLRTGLEYRITSAFSLRGGFARFGDPYKSNLIDETYNIYSGGFGIRQGNFFFDAAYSYTDKDESYTYYSSSEVVNLRDENHQLRMTFGFKF